MLFHAYRIRMHILDDTDSRREQGWWKCNIQGRSVVVAKLHGAPSCSNAAVTQQLCLQLSKITNSCHLVDSHVQLITALEPTSEFALRPWTSFLLKKRNKKKNVVYPIPLCRSRPDLTYPKLDPTLWQWYFQNPISLWNIHVCILIFMLVYNVYRMQQSDTTHVPHLAVFSTMYKYR